MATQRIPAWSANITANAPDDWRAALGRKASELGISAGELVRQLLMAGAAVRCPDLARKLVEAHRRYYPGRAIKAALLLALFVGTLFAHEQLRRPPGHRKEVETRLKAKG